MRKILLTVTILAFFVCPVMAQSYRQYQITFVDEFGDAVTNITSITIFNAGLSTSPTIYSDRGGENTMVNPITTISTNSTFVQSLGQVRWFQRKPSYKLTVTDGAKTLTIDNLTERDTRFPWFESYIVNDAVPGYENVKSPTYGATGDGVTDDTAAIQAAFDSGKSVLIPEGTYIVNSTLNWTTDYATLMFVSHNSIIKAGTTFPVDTPIIHFAGSASDKLVDCSIYNLMIRGQQRGTGVLLTHVGKLRFYSPTLFGCKNGDDNYAFDIIGTYGHTQPVWVHGMWIYGSGESGGIRIDGDGYEILDCGFQDIKIQKVRYGIYLKAKARACYFSNLMIDCSSTDAGTFAIKEEAGANNRQNVFRNAHVENEFANGTGIDMQATDSWSTMWDYWVSSGWSTDTIFGDDISTKNKVFIDGVRLRSRGKVIVLHGAFDGYSPDSTMTWDAVRSASVTSDNTWDKWDFLLPLPNRSIIKRITNEFYTDDGNADLRMQVWKQASWLSTWEQVGSDHDFTGDGPHVATIDYTIEIGYVVKVSILAKRGAGTFLYVFPLSVVADY